MCEAQRWCSHGSNIFEASSMLLLDEELEAGVPKPAEGPRPASGPSFAAEVATRCSSSVDASRGRTSLSSSRRPNHTRSRTVSAERQCAKWDLMRGAAVAAPPVVSAIPWIVPRRARHLARARSASEARTLRVYVFLWETELR